MCESLLTWQPLIPRLIGAGPLPSHLPLQAMSHSMTQHTPSQTQSQGQVSKTERTTTKESEADTSPLPPFPEASTS